MLIVLIKKYNKWLIKRIYYNYLSVLFCHNKINDSELWFIKDMFCIYYTVFLYPLKTFCFFETYDFYNIPQYYT